MKKLCTKKCSKCKGSKCPNYLGYIKNKMEYYNSVLHSKKVEFNDTIFIKNKLDESDLRFIYLFVLFIIFLLIFGGILI